MRHQFTFIFSEVLTSRVWAQPATTRAVWLWFQLSADPEGFVPATVSGVAIGAHVSESEAREAIAFLESKDPDANFDDPTDGRTIERVPRGWRIFGFEDNRARAKREGEKARNRRYMAARRAANKATPANTVELNEPESVVAVTPDPLKMDVPKSGTQIQIQSSSEGGSPLPPVVEERAQSAYTVPSKVIKEIPADFELDDELRMAAKAAGVRDPDAALAKLRKGPIGGLRGIFAKDLKGYIRDTCIPAWRKFEETERFKSGSFPGNAPLPPDPPPKHVKGAPPWVRESHAAFCEANELKLKQEAMAFDDSHHIPPGNLQPNDAAEAFTLFLLRRVTEAA